MERWRGRVALVTGASSGLGYSVAKSLVERGMKVVACARNIDAIQELEKEVSGQAGSLTPVKCDVSKEEEVRAMFQMIRQHSSLGRVDVCINNAGLAHDEPLLTGDPAQWKHMFDVNVLGLLMVTKESFQLMQENNIDDGHILLVNSIFGTQVPSFLKELHCYSATKFAVSAIADGIRHELREMKSKIRISELEKEVSGQAGSLTPVKCDVSKEEEVRAMFQMIRQHSSLGCVDVCINNAGLAHSAPLLTGDPAQWKHMFDVNVLGLLMVTKESFQLMQENNIDDGHILLVNSVLGKSVPSYKESHCYSATKMAVSAIAEGIRHELRELKSMIRISQICPGSVETDFVTRSRGKELAAALYSSMTSLKPADILNIVLHILGSPPHVEINDVVVRPTEHPW